ncbi:MULTISPECIES: hypothetical protein [Paraburkholderia]|jgi:hypothetical protein|uniref:hypothetical protein n=1 Tax=Paraburkholderia TaxID=1822464 RepID=UPI0038BC4399
MSTTAYEYKRFVAAKMANEDDASLWRWFSMLYDDSRIRWCKSPHGWLVSVDHKHLSTEQDFDMAIRMARDRFLSGARRKVN